MFDYHVQTMAHGVNKPLLVSETVQAAVDKKLTSICITDHYPLPPEIDDPTDEKDCSITPEIYFGIYQDQLQQTQVQFKDKIEVLRGAEFDFFPTFTQWISHEINKRQYDYVLGSVHFIYKDSNYYMIDYSADMLKQHLGLFGTYQNVINNYYEQVRALIQSGLFDGLGHLDLVKKFNNGNLFDEQEIWYQDEVQKTLAILAESSMVLEINTKGLRAPCKAMYPSQWILANAYSLNIPVTLGSDAHSPDEVASDFDKAVPAAKKAGYRKIIRYVKRSQVIVPL